MRGYLALPLAGLSFLWFSLAYGEEARKAEIFYVQGDLPESAMATPWRHKVEGLADGTIWDVRKLLEAQGVNLAAQDLALWLPATGQMYVETSGESMELIEVLFQGCDMGWTSVDLIFELSEMAEGKGKSELLKFECRGHSGRTTDVSLKTGAFSAAAKVEPLVGPNGRVTDVTLDLAMKVQRYEVSTKGTFTLEDQKPTVIWQGEDAGAGTKVICTATPRITFTQPLFIMPQGEEKERLVRVIQSAK